MQDWYWYTLLHYMEANGKTNERIKKLISVGAWPPFVQIFLCTNLCKMETSTSVMHNLKYSKIRRNPSSSITNHSWSLAYIQHVNFFQTRGSLFFFWVSSSKTCYGRSPLNSSDRKCIWTENKQAWPHNKLLTNLVSSRRTREFWRSFLYGNRCARFVLTRTRANIPKALARG